MGHYGNESKVMRELIRERQLREQEATREIEMIRAKLIQDLLNYSKTELNKAVKSGELIEVVNNG